MDSTISSVISISPAFATEVNLKRDFTNAEANKEKLRGYVPTSLSRRALKLLSFEHLIWPNISHYYRNDGMGQHPVRYLPTDFKRPHALRGTRAIAKRVAWFTARDVSLTTTASAVGYRTYG